jgi:hypothetical protein
MAKELATMTPKRKARKLAIPHKRDDEDPRPIWPRGKPLPRFKSRAEEVRFWHAYQFEDPPEAEWQEVTYEPRTTVRPRQHVYRVRFDDEEMAKLQKIAKQRGVPVSVVLRDLVRHVS